MLLLFVYLLNQLTVQNKNIEKIGEINIYCRININQALCFDH